MTTPSDPSVPPSANPGPAASVPSPSTPSRPDLSPELRQLLADVIAASRRQPYHSALRDLAQRSNTIISAHRTA